MDMKLHRVSPRFIEVLREQGGLVKTTESTEDTEFFIHRLHGLRMNYTDIVRLLSEP